MRNKVIEMHKAGTTEELNIQLSTVGAIIRKWKVHHNTQILTRTGCQSKQHLSMMMTAERGS